MRRANTRFLWLCPWGLASKRSGGGYLVPKKKRMDEEKHGIYWLKLWGHACAMHAMKY